MLDGINPLGGQTQVNGLSRKALDRGNAVFSVPSAQAQQDLGFPATPPPDALAELDKAARVLDELGKKQVNLHFEIDDTSKRIHVQVRDNGGNVLREIPATRLLDVLAGDKSALAL
jgi:flagellar protein FlaG